MASHSLPTVTSNYTTFPTELDDRFDDLCRMLDPTAVATAVSGIPHNSYRLNNTGGTSYTLDKYSTISGWAAITAPLNININGTVNSTTIPTSATLTKTTDNLSVFAATTSAQLAGVVSDETGSGSLVFGTSPTISTPALTLETSPSVVEGRISWDAANDKIVVGDGTASKYFISTSGISGDITVGTTGISTIGANVVSYGKIQQGVALSVMANASNATANYTALSATAAGNGVLRESGNTLGFGLIGTNNLGPNVVSYTKIQNVSTTDKILGRASAGAGIIEEISCTSAGRNLIAGVDVAAQKTTLGLNNVENTTLSTWAGTANITTVGTIGSGTWQGSAIGNSYLTTTLTGKTYNGLTPTAQATGWTLAGGTASRTLTLSDNTILAGGTHSGTNTGDQATIFDSAYKSIINPGGAQYTTGESVATGAIAITLPVGMTGSMLRMTIKVYEYTTNESFEVALGGYTYATGNTWANNPFAYIIGNPTIDRNFTVRLGYTAGGKAIVYIGELASTWAYPQIFVTDVQVGFGGQSATWTTGWSIGFQATAFEGVTATITTTQVGYGTTTNTANALVKRDASGNFSAGTISATFSGNLTGNVTGNVSGSSGTCTGNAATSTTSSTCSGNAATSSTCTGNAATASAVSGLLLSNTVTVTDTVANNAIGYVSGISLLGQVDGALYSQFYNTSYQHQIFGDYRTGQVALRGKNNGTWQAWRTVLDSSNYNTYAPTKTGTGASGSWNIAANGLYTTGQDCTLGYSFSAAGIAYTGTGGPMPTGQGGGAAMISFHRPGSYGVNFGLDTDNQLKVGGWSMGANAYTVLHSGNYTSYSPPIASATRPGVTRLYRNDNDSNYNVQVNYDGSRWFLRGYNADTFHAECRVSYADSAGSASSASTASSATYANSAGSAPASGGTADYSTYLWSTSHNGTYYVTNAWDGTYWNLTSNHGAAVRCGYSDNSNMVDGYHAQIAYAVNTCMVRGASGETYAAAYYYSSDRKWKDNISSISTDRGIDNLYGRSFTWKTTGKKDIGFIAQEVQEEVPEAVVEDEEGNLSINLTPIVALLVEEVKALKKELKELKGGK